MKLYRFEENLLKLSYNKNFDVATTEWKKIQEEKRDEQDRLCICQRKVKNVIYMFNVITKHTIAVGTTCYDGKLKPSDDKIKNKLLNSILKKSIEKGEYVMINDIVAYSNSIENQLILLFEKKRNRTELEDLINDVHDLIHNYGFISLHDVYVKLKTQLEELDLQELINYHKQKYRKVLYDVTHYFIKINKYFTIDQTKYSKMSFKKHHKIYTRALTQLLMHFRKLNENKQLHVEKMNNVKREMYNYFNSCSLINQNHSSTPYILLHKHKKSYKSVLKNLLLEIQKKNIKKYHFTQKHNTLYLHFATKPMFMEHHQKYTRCLEQLLSADNKKMFIQMTNNKQNGIADYIDWLMKDRYKNIRVK